MNTKNIILILVILTMLVLVIFKKKEHFSTMPDNDQINKEHKWWNSLKLFNNKLGDRNQIQNSVNLKCGINEYEEKSLDDTETSCLHTSTGFINENKIIDFAGNSGDSLYTTEYEYADTKVLNNVDEKPSQQQKTDNNAIDKNIKHGYPQDFQNLTLEPENATDK